MIQSNNRINKKCSANLTDYSRVCPEGLRNFYVYATFTDNSFCLLDNIFAANRAEAFKQAFSRFSDCFQYLTELSVYSEDGED